MDKVLLSSKKMNWETPQKMFDKWNELLDGQRLNPAPFPSMLVIFNNKKDEIN